MRIERMVRRMIPVLAATLLVASSAFAQSRLPSRLSDTEFWFLSQQMSEPGGVFQSENYVSNEQEMQFVIPRFSSLSPAARQVYLGVGPEQNYTYIAAIRPQIAFILDIRRGNLLEHLMYKALFELSDDRADFLSRLLSRRRPADVSRTTSIDSIADRLYEERADTVLFRRNRGEILDVLMRKHSLPLSGSDTGQLAGIYEKFMQGGFGITYSFPRPNTRGDANLYDLIVARDANGVQQGFLASDSAFRFVKEMHARNMIVPVVGDFAGPRALRMIGDWVRQQSATVGAFYVSNVEQYLFQNDSWRSFYSNVATLPIDSTSMFVRSIANATYTYQARGPAMSFTYDSTVANVGRLMRVDGVSIVDVDRRPGFRSKTSTIRSIMDAVSRGSLLEYFGLAQLSR